MAATLVLAAWEPEIAPLRRLARAVAPERLVLGTGGRRSGRRGRRCRRRDRRSPAGPGDLRRHGWRVSARTRDRGNRDVAVASELCLVSTAALRGDGYLPEPLATRAATSASLGATLAACGPGRRPVPLLGVACPIAITRSATSAATSRTRPAPRSRTSKRLRSRARPPPPGSTRRGGARHRQPGRTARPSGVAGPPRRCVTRGLSLVWGLLRR